MDPNNYDLDDVGYSSDYLAWLAQHQSSPQRHRHSVSLDGFQAHQPYQQLQQYEQLPGQVIPSSSSNAPTAHSAMLQHLYLPTSLLAGSVSPLQPTFLQYQQQQQQLDSQIAATPDTYYVQDLEQGSCPQTVVTSGPSSAASSSSSSSRSVASAVSTAPSTKTSAGLPNDALPNTKQRGRTMSFIHPLQLQQAAVPAYNDQAYQHTTHYHPQPRHHHHHQRSMSMLVPPTIPASPFLYSPSQSPLPLNQSHAPTSSAGVMDSTSLLRKNASDLFLPSDRVAPSPILSTAFSASTSPASTCTMFDHSALSSPKFARYSPPLESRPVSTTSQPANTRTADNFDFDPATFVEGISAAKNAATSKLLRRSKKVTAAAASQTKTSNASTLTGSGPTKAKAQFARKNVVDDTEPLFVNAKQYHRIVKRRQARLRLAELHKLSTERKVCALQLSAKWNVTTDYAYVYDSRTSTSRGTSTR